jgi:hypothetical protein
MDPAYWAALGALRAASCTPSSGSTSCCAELLSSARWPEPIVLWRRRWWWCTTWLQGAIIAATIGVLALTTRQSVIPAYRRDSVAVPVAPAEPVVVPAPVAAPVSDCVAPQDRWA